LTDDRASDRCVAKGIAEGSVRLSESLMHASHRNIFSTRTPMRVCDAASCVLLIRHPNSCRFGKSQPRASQTGRVHFPPCRPQFRRQSRSSERQSLSLSLKINKERTTQSQHARSHVACDPLLCVTVARLWYVCKFYLLVPFYQRTAEMVTSHCGQAAAARVQSSDR
jgi:hypothetical protein